ncbi:MAG: LemA family protein [Bacteroidales bacterium]|nr:LemA family protein [Bacteroidales bacterium]
MTTIIIIAFVLVAALWVVSVQRKLVGREELCKNAMSQIGVQQNSRWDALTALAELVKSYNEHEYRTICDVISKRSTITGASKASEADAQEAYLGLALKNIKIVAEQYPQLKASENYGKAMESVNVYENQVRMSRMVYNDSITRFNKTVRQFPDSLVAGILGFAVKDYLAEDVTKAQMPSMKI